MRNLVLSVALIALPAFGFTLVEMKMAPKAEATAPAVNVSTLGDLSAYQAIVDDTRKIAAGGDLLAAEKRATDLETLWDQNADALQAKDATAWGVIDGANDAVFKSLRAAKPDAATVDAALAALQAALAGQGGATPSGGVQQVAGIDVTDANGHPLPCEKMAASVRDALAGKTADAKVADLQSKALERCNADDDANSDAFSAQALAMLKG